MAPSPHRPFVPHRTPKTARPAVGSPEFRLARPFVPGTERETVEIAQAELRGAVQLESPARLRSIEDFLDLSSRSAAPVALHSTAGEFSSEFDEGSAELPPIEHFLDPLPRTGDYAPERSNAFDPTRPAGHEDIPANDPTSGTLASDWADTDWQRYDWRSLAALGEGAEAAASNDWATTDWDATGPRAEKKGGPTAAQAIASALDQIAQRIRDGELAVPMTGGATDPAGIAATLAALLGIRT